MDLRYILPRGWATRAKVCNKPGRLISLITVLFFVMGCKAGPAVTPSPSISLADTHQPALSTATSRLMPLTATPIYTPTFVPTPTTGVIPVKFSILPTTLYQPGIWDISFPYSDPGFPELFVETSAGFHLDPAFFPIKIEMAYKWFGIGDTVVDFQIIKLLDSDYWLGDTAIPMEAVSALVQAVSGLHPQPKMLEATTHTDDYPRWAIELKNAQGVPVLLFSSSNGPNYAPWNVIYNGHIYVQFDGQIGQALASLFEVKEGQPMAWTSVGSGEEDEIIMNTIDPPNQLTLGYSGLIAFQGDFRYQFDSEKNELRLDFHGYMPDSATTQVLLGALSGFKSIDGVSVVDETGEIITCTAQELPPPPPNNVYWQYLCPVSRLEENNRYRYPITVELTLESENYIFQGDLFGYKQIGYPLPFQSFPDEIGTLLEANTTAQDLMSDHVFTEIESYSKVKPGSSPLYHYWHGDVALLGQARLGDRVIRYTVTTRLIVEGNSITTWDLDRKKLERLLQDVLSQPLTQPFLKEDPGVILNLFYSENPQEALVPDTYLDPCGNLPTASQLPEVGEPLRAFAFNRWWELYNMDILLMDGQLRIHNLRINRLSPEDAIWLSLLPVELSPQSALGIEEIYVNSYTPSIIIFWSADIGGNDLDVLKTRLDELPGEKEWRENSVVIKYTTFWITPDGRLELMDCQAP